MFLKHWKLKGVIKHYSKFLLKQIRQQTYSNPKTIRKNRWEQSVTFWHICNKQYFTLSWAHCPNNETWRWRWWRHTVGILFFMRDWITCQMRKWMETEKERQRWKFCFQQDNDHKQAARVTIETFGTMCPCVSVRPSQSPDLIPPDNLWHNHRVDVRLCGLCGSCDKSTIFLLILCV